MVNMKVKITTFPDNSPSPSAELYLFTENYKVRQHLNAKEAKKWAKKILAQGGTIETRSHYVSDSDHSRGMITTCFYTLNAILT